MTGRMECVFMVNATKAINARQRAREASLKFYEREKEREGVQLQYFQAMEAVDRVHAQRDRELEAVRSRAERAASTAVADADKAIVALLELRVTRSEIQERLGCSPADIRRAEAASQVDASTESVASDAEDIGATAEVESAGPKFGDEESAATELATADVTASDSQATGE